MRRSMRFFGWCVVIAIALAVRFVLETTLVGRLPAAISTCAIVVPAALLVVLATLGLPARGKLCRRDTLLGAAAGVLGIWLAPFLVASVRHTSAPSGAESLFFTTACWGVLLVAGGLVGASTRPTGVRLVGALLGLTAAAGLLANWERPSSFSPLVRFPAEELVMLAAGVAFVVAVRLLEGLVRRHGPLAAARAFAVPGAAAALAGAVVLAPDQLPSLGASDVWAVTGPAALATFALILGWCEALRDASPDRVAAAYFLPPVLVTALTLVERSVGVFGPNPIQRMPALAAIAVALVATALVAYEPPLAVSEADSSRASLPVLAARGLAALAVVLAAVALVLPDLAVTVSGVLSTGPAFMTSFAMRGYETAGGLLAAGGALLAVACVLRADRASRMERALWFCAVAVTALAWSPLHTTPLHTWNRWIPPEVQQDYGTEYASRTERPVTGPWEPAALASAVLCVGVLTLTKRAEGPEPVRTREVSKA